MTNTNNHQIDLHLIFERHVSVTLPKEGVTPEQTIKRSPTAAEFQEIVTSIGLAAKELGGEYKSSHFNEQSQRVFVVSVGIHNENKMRRYAKRAGKSEMPVPENSTTKSRTHWPKLVSVRTAGIPTRKAL